MDVDAEREKITKEIEELERILDPGSTSINVEVSESSLESDSDAGKLLSVARRAVSTFGPCQLSYTVVLLGPGRFSPGLASASPHRTVCYCPFIICPRPAVCVRVPASRRACASGCPQTRGRAALLRNRKVWPPPGLNRHRG